MDIALIQFALLSFSLSLVTAAALAPPEAWLTPIGKTNDNDGEDDEY